MYNILNEPLIRMDKADGSRVEASLLEVYAALMADKVEAFPALRPHQRHAWHAFLVQLGAMAVHGAGLPEPPADADEWRRIIRALTCDDFPKDEPWQLVVDDITEPAFMQPPASSKGQKSDYTRESLTPDELDPLDTAKNHELKRSVTPALDIDSWIFALITEQTTDAHMANNPSISRISGKGSRLAFSLAPSPVRVGTHARRDIVALLDQWDTVGEGYPTSANGHALLWIVKWDGKKQLTLDELHPLYIEVCRRRRLRLGPDRSLFVRKASGTTTRILGASTSAGKAALKGRTGDPWIPINEKREKALTLPPGVGFNYKNIAECLNLAGRNAGNWQVPLLCKATMGEGNSCHHMALVVRGAAPGDGQKKTGGYYERIIQFRQKTYQAFGRRRELGQLGDIARGRIREVGKVEQILRHAIATFAAEGNSDLSAHGKGQPSPNQLAQPLVNRLDEIVDSRFFKHLQDEFEADQSERDVIRRRWLMNGTDGVIDEARKIMNAAEDALPCPSIQRFRARVNADGVFWGRLRSNDVLRFVFEKDDQSEATK